MAMIVSCFQKIRKKSVFELLFFCSLTAILIKIAVVSSLSPALEGDTRVLVSWAQNMLNCVDQGQYVGCVHGGHFPLFQYIPSFILISLGAEQEHILQTLAYISLVSFGGIIGVFLSYSRTLKTRSLRYAFLLLLLSSPLVGYARSSFGEMLGAFFIFSCTVVCLKRGSGWLLFLLSVLVCITKDFAFLFLALLATASLMPDIVLHPSRVRRQIVGVALGLFFGVSVVAAFNYFRTGAVYNTLLLADYMLVPTMLKQLDFFFGLWLAPNGGLLFFWPAFVIALGIIGYQSLSTRQGSLLSAFSIEKAPLLCIVLVLFGLTSGLSRWWAPFGWIAWGPRLMLLWLPALGLLLLHFYGRQLVAMISPQWWRGWKGMLASFFVVFFCLPQFYVTFDLQKFASMVTAPTAVCPEMPYVDQNAAYYYYCMWYRMWQPEFLIHWRVLVTDLDTGKILWGLVYVMMMMSGGVAMTMPPIATSPPQADG
jgi:hypothetical protein